MATLGVAIGVVLAVSDGLATEGLASSSSDEIDDGVPEWAGGVKLPGGGGGGGPPKLGGGGGGGPPPPTTAGALETVGCTF